MQELSREIKWFYHEGEIDEIYTTGLQYAFCTEEFEQHLPWVYCKDFLHDVLFAYLNNSPLSLYGYEYDPASQPAPNLKRMRLLVGNKSDPEFGKKIPNALEFINQVERSIRIPSLSRVFKCIKLPLGYAKCGIYMFSGSHHWLLSAPMISLYTLMLRTGFVHTPGTSFETTIRKVVTHELKPYQSEDSEQLRNAEAGIKRIRKEGYRSIFSSDIRKNYPDIGDSESMHHDFGIGSFSQEITREYMPSWYPEEEEVYV